MDIPSNLYAEKVYSEHPAVLWSLDDNADYISLITEDNRDISLWSITNGTGFNTSYSQNPPPFLDSFLSIIYADDTSASTFEVELKSPDLVKFTDLNSSLKTFCIGTYILSACETLKSVSIGYEYTDTSTGLIVQNLKKFSASSFASWSFISETFEYPETENTYVRVVIKIEAEQLLVGDCAFFINGITIGGWSEEFNTTSLGVTTTTIPSSIAIEPTQCVEAKAYGLGGQNGYYLAKDYALVAKNAGVPMVYGASSTTILSPNNNLPSLIIPGYGFLNKSGQFKEYTAEFWIKINSSTTTSKRIFGPISSTDGLYIDGAFLTLVIGNKFASHFIGEWFRPMLIHIRVSNNAATMLINGDQVLSLSINTSTLNLPDILNEEGKNQDWIGFYSYDDITPIEIDCVALYNYQVPINVAKRRFVYGQAVVSPEDINASYGGTSAFIDYTFADYTANQIYPDLATWSQGSFDNLSVSRLSLSTPQYSLPQIFLNNKTLEDLYNDNLDIQDVNDYNFITFRPNSGWDSELCYFNFNNFNLLNKDIKAIYGVFSSENMLTSEFLISIYNPLSGNVFSIFTDLGEIVYSLTFNGISEEIYRTIPIVENEKFAAGINIDLLSEYFGGNISTFFGNRNGLKIYVAGDPSSAYQFTGKMYSFGLSTFYNANKISNRFDFNGIAIVDDMSTTSAVEPENAIALIEHTASYTLLPSQAYNSYFLDIGVSGYWQDYMPLSYFGQYVKNQSGSKYYDLDFLQFNIGYPKPSDYFETETTSSWTYEDLFSEYGHPVQRTYYQLDNYLYTGWTDYEDMSQKAIKYYEYNTNGASIRSYLTFQYILDGANTPLDSFTTTEPAKLGSVIDLENYQSWDTTKFEVVDNTIIYPSQTVDFNDIAIVYNLEFNVRGILSKPLSLKKLEIASQSFNSNSFNPVGTRFGVNMFPYTRAGIYFDYKAKNPFSIYKGSTPYLYLTRNSGIEVRQKFNFDSDSGLAVPINTGIATDFKVSAAQLWMRYDQDQFPIVPAKIFEIDYKEDTILFYMQANSEAGDRAKIYAISKNSGLEFNGLSYCLNGSLVREPVLTIKQWAVLGIGFASSLSYDLYAGSINLNGPLLFNNIAYYQANSLQQTQSILTRPWSRVKTDGITEYDWEYWDNNFNWNGVLVLSSSDLYFVNPADVYKTYIGTNKIIVDDDQGLSIDMDNLSIYTAITWSSSVGTPV